MHPIESNNIPFQIQVWPDCQTPHSIAEDIELPTLTYYLPSNEYRSGQSMLLLPGGGYRRLSSFKEGHRPAQLLAANGIAAAVLEYRHAPNKYPTPLLDAQRAMRILRQKAAKYDDLNENAVGVMGFSAGGHLAGLTATHSEHPDGRVGDELDTIPCIANFAALIYPVVSFGRTYSHNGSENNLLGTEATDTLQQKLSIENAINKSTPPMFIAHGQLDESVPSENAIVLYQALTRHKIPANLHIYEDTAHGIGIAANHPWSQALLQWLAAR